MKRVLKNLLIGSTLVVGSAGAGVGIYFGVQGLIENLNGSNTASPDLTPKPPNPGETVEIGTDSLNNHFPLVNNYKAVTIKRNYKQNRNFNLVEYEYRGQYFLDQDGLELLSQTLNERLPFGSEVDQLKYISFNHPLALPAPGRINGQYNPFTMELDLDVRSFFDQNTNSYIAATLEQKVEFVFTVILHEYGHHLANSYITAIDPDDSLNYNNLATTNNKVFFDISPNPNRLRFIQKGLAGTFFQQWLNALNYNNANFEQAEKNQAGSATNVFQNYSSKQIFAAANYAPSAETQALKQSNEVFQGAIGSNQTSLFNNRLSNMAAYSYGIDELFTRHLVSFNYIPQTFPLWSNNLDSYSPDIALRNQISFINNNSQYDWNNQIYAADNIFGGFIKQFDQSEVTVQPRFNELLNAYKAVMGEGKLVSQIFFDNTNNFSRFQNSNWTPQSMTKDGFNRIKIGGYVPKKSQIKGLVFQFSDKITAFVPFENVFQSKNLHTKNSPAAKRYTEDEDRFVPYITKAINLNDSLFTSKTLLAINAWEDQNGNDTFDGGEIKIIQPNDVVLSRPITTFRETLKQKIFNFNNNYQVINQTTGYPIPFLPANFQRANLITNLKMQNQNLIIQKSNL